MKKTLPFTFILPPMQLCFAMRTPFLVRPQLLTRI
jgi:hypothetical protein